MNSSTSVQARESGPDLLASKRHTVRFLCIVGGIAAVGLMRARQPLAAAPPSRLPLYFSVIGLQLLFVWFVSKGVRAHGGRLTGLIGRRWRSLTDAIGDVGLASLLVLLLRSLTPFLQHILGSSPSQVGFLLPNGLAESVLWVFVAIIAGGSEEMVYRGYLQPQLATLTKSLPFGIVLQAFVFGVSHLYQGLKPAVITAVYGFAFGLLAAWRKSILAGSVAHAAIDVIGGLFHR